MNVTTITIGRLYPMTIGTDMKLRKLEITLETWGENAGKYTGEISFVDEKGKIEVLLDPAIANDLLQVVGSTIHRYALNGMAKLEESIRESVKAANENPPG